MPPILVIPFPLIDPVALSLGPVEVRWYALAYVAGLVLAIWYMKRLVANPALWSDAGAPASSAQIDDFLLWATLGVVLGGRIGYVLFYNPAHFFHDPATVFAVWRGGMSFHGGFLGVVVAAYVYGRRHGIGLDRMLDLSACGVTIGLGLGRIANFINGELYGRTSEVPWAMVFPGGGPLPRHPSQIYEAILEGLVLFCVIRLATHRLKALRTPGLVSGIFAIGYGASRIVVELFREPDQHIGYLASGWLTMGMVLSLPLIAVGVWLIIRARVPVQ